MNIIVSFLFFFLPQATYAFQNCPNLNGTYQTQWSGPVFDWTQSACSQVTIQQLKKSYYPLFTEVRNRCGNESFQLLQLTIDGTEQELCESETHTWTLRSYFSNTWYGDFPGNVDADPVNGKYLIVELQGYSLETSEPEPNLYGMSHEWNNFYSILEIAQFQKSTVGEIQEGKTIWFNRIDD